MFTLFDALPGLDVKVSEIDSMLSSMWQGKVSAEDKALSDARASQLNLVLHFGKNATTQEGLEAFETAIAFAQRYPCRLMILCPADHLKGEDSVDAKLFSLCYIGDAQARAFCACEAVILSYLPEDVKLLEGFFSLWLENDLPIYHWFQGVSTETLESKHLPFLYRCRRMLYDSAIEDPAVRTLALEQPQLVVDLAQARLSPVKQAIGQFLAGYRPADLVDGLASVGVFACGERKAEGACMLEWIKQSLEACGAAKSVVYEVAPTEGGKDCTMEIRWRYLDEQKYFSWVFHADRSSAHIHANLGKGVLDVGQQLQLMTPEQALAEAIFA